MPVFQSEKGGFRYIVYDPVNFSDFLQFRELLRVLSNEPSAKKSLIIDALFPRLMNQSEFTSLLMIIKSYRNEKSKVIIRVNKLTAIRLSKMIGEPLSNVKIVVETCT